MDTPCKCKWMSFPRNVRACIMFASVNIDIFQFFLMPHWLNFASMCFIVSVNFRSLIIDQHPFKTVTATDILTVKLNNEYPFKLAWVVGGVRHQLRIKAGCNASESRDPHPSLNSVHKIKDLESRGTMDLALGTNIVNMVANLKVGRLAIDSHNGVIYR
ncbi:hypothetical protein VNO77_13567 [Canavalia gladiata]|uniref:Uncharacterized protein n=1 Tax=Canavalia gladiata TaxID=3824 RepID=A0AAN9M2L8_CANGL